MQTLTSLPRSEETGSTLCSLSGLIQRVKGLEVLSLTCLSSQLIFTFSPLAVSVSYTIITRQIFILKCHGQDYRAQQRRHQDL